MNVQQRITFLKARAETPDHQEFMRLLVAYLVLFDPQRSASQDIAQEIVEAREALYEWARPESKAYP